MPPLIMGGRKERHDREARWQVDRTKQNDRMAGWQTDRTKQGARNWRGKLGRFRARVWRKFCAILVESPVIVVLVILSIVGALAAIAFSLYGELFQRVSVFIFFFIFFLRYFAAIELHLKK